MYVLYTSVIDCDQSSQCTTIAKKFHTLFFKIQSLNFKNMENRSKNLIPLTMTSFFPTPDSITGLTGPQKCTIYAAWQLIKKDFQIHVRNVFAM